MLLPNKLKLAHLPTPIWRHAAIDALAGTQVWIKRDDMSASGAAGNKIRKLEFLLYDAQQQQATAIITCGGVQSNHARASALLARELGMDCHLFLRVPDPQHPPLSTGNLFLDYLAGAQVHYLTPKQFVDRDAIMQAFAAEQQARGARPYVIPVGGSNALGSLGMVEAMAEIRGQLQADTSLPHEFDLIVAAAGSGGTVAGAAVGAALYHIAPTTLGIAVCDDKAYFENIAAALISQMARIHPRFGVSNTIVIRDEFIGPGYGFASPAQLHLLREVSLRSGLLLDPVYTAKAFYGLCQLNPKPARVLFIHTGGVAALLAHEQTLRGALLNTGTSAT